MLNNTLNEISTNEELDIKLSKEINIEDVKVSKMPKIFAVLKESVIYIAISLIIILAIRGLVIQHVRVDGTSMYPTLVDNQHLLIEKLSYRFKDVERFDIIVFRPYYNEKKVFYVKRVIGLPGEKVQIKDNTIYIDGKPLEEDYSQDIYTDGKLAAREIQLGDEDYFVLGDNRDVSKDSREKEIGLLNRKYITGRVWLSIYPLKTVGIIKH